MSAPLEYKGLNSTRVKLGLAAGLGVTAGWLWGDVTATQWLDFLQWTLISYMGSEVGAKAASAYRDKG